MASERSRELKRRRKRRRENVKARTRGIAKPKVGAAPRIPKRAPAKKPAAGKATPEA